MVRPTIEYVCAVWNPHQQYLSDKLEKIQKNVSRWILGSSIEYNEHLEYLGWPSPLSRRDFLSIVQLFKFILMVFLQSIYMITYSFRKVVPGLLIVTKFGHHMLELTSINSPFGLGILISGMICQNI